ncbi:hypothetical protein PIB30_011000 [Stylosanthes scabra]|uniref:TF-B3 domain-containing protein n=1 Tax=Stylosanthes scabra TaxID=79078 RepID=A0ABU6V8Y8_9FABA|nr:hypothetical protein [Stylosanthes scabra]
MANTTPAKQLSFFKVFLPQFSSERLPLPKNYVASTRMKERVPEEFRLRNGRGREWRVKTSCIDEKVYFDDGWKKFASDNALQAAVFFLVFYLEDSNTFMFKIFEESSMCEKTQIKEEEEEEAMEDIEMKQVLEAAATEEGEEEEDDDDYDDEEENEEIHHHRAGKAPIKSKRRNSAGSSVSKKGEDIIAKYGNQHNPYFVPKINRNRPNELQIPNKLIKDYSIIIPETIKLCCKNIRVISPGKTTIERSHWPDVTGIRSKWLDGRICISEWGKFCRTNHVDTNDAFICELKMRNDRRNVKNIQVYVVKKQA